MLIDYWLKWLAWFESVRTFVSGAGLIIYAAKLRQNDHTLYSEAYI